MTTVTGETFTPPLFDPVVATHYNNSASYVEALVHQIDNEQIYAPLFKGKRDMTFLDIGANIGLVSIYAYDSCKRIMAVEPAPQTFSVLKAMTLKLPRIELLNAALTPEDGWTEFHVNNENTTASSTVNTFGDKILANGMTLTSILNHAQFENVNVCKIDVEGAEGDALSFEQLANAAPIVRSYFIETHNDPASTWQEKQRILTEFLNRLGYTVEASAMTIIATR